MKHDAPTPENVLSKDPALRRRQLTELRDAGFIDEKVYRELLKGPQS